MKRREFVTKLGLAALAGGSMTACQKEKTAEVQQKLSQEPVRHWKMVTTWPKNFPILGSGAERIAELITSMSNGKLVVKVYAAGELVPAFECFDVVSQGAAQMGHSAPYYWQGKEPVLQFFGGIPFGMSALQMDAWFYHGEGLKLWEEAYAPFGLIPMPAGNTGVQMGGWFNREINKIEDFKGLKMRMPGLGGEVLRRIGAAPVLLPGGELLIAMQTGVIDAVEWASPYLDLVFGLDKVAKYYYYPGWQECGTTLECMVNRDAMEELPDYLRQIIRVAAQSTNVVMRSEYVWQKVRRP